MKPTPEIQRPHPSPARLPVPSPQSQSFSRGYGSILPTSLIYIVLSTRGYTPWRPDAVMSTTRGANKSRYRVFKGHRECTGQRERYAALPATKPYLRVIRFQGLLDCEEEKRTLPGILADVPDFVCVAAHYPRPGAGILTCFPFDRRAFRERPLSNGILLSLRIDSPVSNCCSHGTFPHFSLQSSHLNICYYHQDLH